MQYKKVDQIVLEAYNKKLIEKAKYYNTKPDEDMYWHASSLGLCMRSHWFTRMNFQSDASKATRDDLTGELGNMCHEFISKALKEEGRLLLSEKTLIDEETKWKGRFDNLVKLDNGNVMVDIKSQRPEAFFRRSKESSDKKIKHHQKVQLASYYYFGNKYLKHIYPEWVGASGKVIDYSVLYYIDRGGGVREEFSLHFTDEFIQKNVLDELKALNYYYDNCIVPSAESCWQSWQCNYCNHKPMCKALRELEKQAGIIKRKKPQIQAKTRRLI